MKDSYKFDFINYFRKDIDWLAFVMILVSVNLGLMLIVSEFHPEQYTLKPG